MIKYIWLTLWVSTKIKDEVDENLIKCIESGMLINGPEVKNFSENLKVFLNVKNVIPCANGTDALQMLLCIKS